MNDPEIPLLYAGQLSAHIYIVSSANGLCEMLSQGEVADL